MIETSLKAFRAELAALRAITADYSKKTVRDGDLRERCRSLFRTWSSVVEPAINQKLGGKRDLYKLTSELEKVAQLASKFRSVSEYRKRLNKAVNLFDGLVIYLPATAAPMTQPAVSRESLFLEEIPDLPGSLVPNAIVGWRSQMQHFLSAHPFDTSVFIMIRYRTRNKNLISDVKEVLQSNGLFGVLASDHDLTDDLYNPIACLLCCFAGIAVFDKPERKQEFNPNVAYELGMLHLLGRPCLILKNRVLQTLQTDILMKLYTPYSNRTQVTKEIDTWIDRKGFGNER